MKNITTLSLITVAILAINGCGGGNSSSSKIELSSIQKLSEVSTTHTQAEWSALENEIQDLEKTALFNTVLLDSIEKNVANLTYVGIDKEMAYATNSDAMFDDLTDLDIGELDNQVVAECNDDESCKEMAYVSLDNAFIIDKEMAYAMAEDFRGDDNALVNDKLVKSFTCENGLIKTVQHYGLEDSFSTANGVEPSTPAPHIALVPWIDNYPFPTTGYDEVNANRIFTETIKNLPANVVNGNFYIGFKSNGTTLQGNDTMTFGNYANSNVESIPLNTLNWTTTAAGGTTIFNNSFNNIAVNGSTLLDMVNNSQQFDIVVQDDTSVDFITVATCSKPNPIKEIMDIVNKFECSEKDGKLFQIVGGTRDAFDPTADQPTVVSSNFLTRANPYAVAEYDATAYDKHLLDTLTLPTGTITQAEFSVGYKALGSSLVGNDTIHIGEYGVEHAGGRYILYPSTTNPNATEPLWVESSISTGEKVRTVDLNAITSSQGNSMLDWIQGKSDFEVRVEDDTSVDFTQLNLCVKDNCDENAKNIDLNLSKLTSWTNRPSDAVENNVFNGTEYQGVWDDTINWFDFTNSHSDEILEIPFCACGNTIVNINNLKADNSATIKLDGTLVASQTANDQAAMKRDDMGGVHEDGSLTVPAGTNGGTNHVLRVNVHNLGSEFGVAIDGTLSFKGNLGKCAQ